MSLAQWDNICASLHFKLLFYLCMSSADIVQLFCGLGSVCHKNPTITLWIWPSVFFFYFALDLRLVWIWWVICGINWQMKILSHLLPAKLFVAALKPWLPKSPCVDESNYVVEWTCTFWFLLLKHIFKPRCNCAAKRRRARTVVSDSLC